MPWQDPEGFAFDRITIALHAPNETGIYGLFDGERWVYIDRAENLREALFEHLETRHGGSRGNAARRFGYVVCASAECEERLRGLIMEYQTRDRSG